MISSKSMRSWSGAGAKRSALLPENRLVARTLETRWNERLAELSYLEKEWNGRKREWERQEAPTREQVLTIAEDLPRLWNAPTTSAADRKRILRVLIEDVTIRSEPEGPEVELGLRWCGGAAETLHLRRPPRIQDRIRTPPEVVESIRELATALTDEQIVERLNGQQRVSGKGRPFTRDAVRWIRFRHQIPGPRLYRDGELSVKETAAHFGVSPNVVYYWIERGELTANRLASGWPWRIRLDPDTEAQLRAWVARSSRIKKPTDSESPR